MTDLITKKQDVLKGCRICIVQRKYQIKKCQKNWLCQICKAKLETLNDSIDEQIKLLTDFIEFLKSMAFLMAEENHRYNKNTIDITRDYELLCKENLNLKTQINKLIKARGL